jgi:Na+/melibiose symporter-like transporter
MTVLRRVTARFTDFFTEPRKRAALRRFIARFTGFLRRRRNLIVLLFAIFVIGGGEELWMRFVPKYLQALGVTALVIGLYDGLRTSLSAVYAYRGGVLVKLWGYRRVFIVLNLVSIAGYALVLFIPNWGGVIAGMVLFLSWSCVSLPATFALLAATLAAERHAVGAGAQSVIGHLPIIVAPFLGGMLIDRFGVIPGVRIALMISILLSAATIFVQWQLREKPSDMPPPEPAGPGVGAPQTERWSVWRNVREFNYPLRRLLVSDVLIGACERIPYAWVVIFAMDYIGMSGKEVGMLITVEMVVAALCIMPASRIGEKFSPEPFVIVLFILFALFPIALLRAHGFTTLALAFAIRGLKECGVERHKALVIGYCKPGQREQMAGAYFLVRDLIVSVAALAGAYLWSLEPRLNLVAAVILGVVGTLFYIRTIQHTRATAPPIVLYGRKPPTAANESKWEK